MSTQGRNRLGGEKSPYLLQHRDNPVHWYPWCEEAFAAARASDKPVFLSIGYSTCHWCHVMAHESFENESIAALMNELFVNIKVDREERPDVDHLYMKAVTALSEGQGGWPLSVFLTPELVPYFGGTYFPPEDRYGRPGFPVVLRRMAEVYRSRREDVDRVAANVTRFLHVRPEPGNDIPGPELLDRASAQLSGSFDAVWGGFGSAPKFPRSMTLSFLLRHHRRSPSVRTLEMAKLTLDRMAQGGLHDQLGGGFHRYATDGRWLVPHFEKMLYDNALLARTYLEAYQLTREDRYARIARDIFAYLNRDLRDPAGACYAAEDADSEGEEGVFYVWSESEIEQHLGSGAGLFCDYYQVSEEGNFEGRNILWAPVDLQAVAERHHLDVEAAGLLLAEQRQRLLEIRSRRPRPQRDTKILSAWNGLALGAFALGYQVLGDPAFLAAAGDIARFLLDRMWDGQTLCARWADGEVRFHGYLDDYAFVAWGLFDLYEATFDVRYLESAFALMDSAERQFATPGGGYFFSPPAHTELLTRPEEFYDGAIPSGNAVMALNLLKRAEYTGERTHRDRAVEVIKAYAAEIDAHPAAFPQWLCALDFLHGRPRQIVVAGPIDAASQFWPAIRGEFVPNKVVVHTVDGRDAVTRIAPVARDKSGAENGAVVYVCRDYACQAPARDVAEVRAQLQDPAANFAG
jgi:uncharacterized protein